jgi:hypothetical protein
MSTYAMVANGSVDASEIERADAEVVDVTFSWGANVLEVKHLEAGEELTIGEEGCDLLVPSAVLGAASAKVLRREDGRVVIAPPASAGLKVDGFARSEATIDLAAGHTAEMLVGEFAIRFSIVAAAKAVPAVPLTTTLGGDGFRSVLGSAFLHAAMIASVAFFMPSMSSTDNEDIDRDRLVLIQKMLNVSAQKEQERQQDQANNEGAGETGGDPLQGPGAKGDPGKAGKLDAPPANNRMAVKGDAKPENATLAREREMALAMSSPLLGILRATANDPNAPTAPWATVQNGTEDQNAIASLFGPTIGDGQGTGGLGLSGTGEGGGLKGPFIGLGGNNGGIGGLGQCGNAPCSGTGISGGHFLGGHPKKDIQVRPLALTANGRLDPAVIQRIIQQNSGRFRQCYMTGLARNPSLEGHVGVKFVIARDGSVSMAVDGGSTIPDGAVSSCVVRSFTNLSFPAPDGGQVTVQYGFAFSPGQ